jgi:hypothetical protein
MAVELAEVVSFIAGLSIAGVNIDDFDSIAVEFDTRRFPLLSPDTNAPVVMESITRNSFGDGTTAKQTLVYLIPYVLACYEQGAERGPRIILPDIVETVTTVASALIKNDTPTDLTVDLQIRSMLINTLVNDPAGNSYHGAKFMLVVREFIEGVT